jgi:hypothetical protein
MKIENGLVNIIRYHLNGRGVIPQEKADLSTSDFSFFSPFI